MDSRSLDNECCNKGVLTEQMKRTLDTKIAEMNDPEEDRVLARDWTPNDLREIWDYSNKNFERFLKLLQWMDSLK